MDVDLKRLTIARLYRHRTTRISTTVRAAICLYSTSRLGIVITLTSMFPHVDTLTLLGPYHQLGSQSYRKRKPVPHFFPSRQDPDGAYNISQHRALTGGALSSAF